MYFNNPASTKNKHDNSTLKEKFACHPQFPRNMKKLLLPLFVVVSLISDTSTRATTATATATPRLSNLSTRGFVQTGDNILDGGFIVQGTQSKTVIVRAIGPELTQYGVPNALADPILELHDGTGALIASNDNWQTTVIGGVITANQVAAIRNSGLAPGDARESAINTTLPPGNYTAIIRGKNNATGVALVEVYDLSPGAGSVLKNLGTRGFVQTGDNILDGGFIVQGPQSKTVIVRAIGPELTQYGVPNALADPILELHDDRGALIASNDDWQHTIIGRIISSNQSSDIQYYSGLAPGDARESAIIANLPPGNYTAIVRGKNNTSGVALVEVYDLEPIFSTASATISPSGGTIQVPRIGLTVFLSGAFTVNNVVQAVASGSPDIEADFNLTAAIYSAGPQLPYQLRINTGDAAPTMPIDVIFSIPEAFIASLPSGSGIQGFVQLLTDTDSESQDVFDVCPSVFNSTSKTLRITLPREAFTNERRADGKFEAIAMVSSIGPRTLEGFAAIAKDTGSFDLMASNTVATDSCTLNPIGSPLTNTVITEAYNPPGCIPAPTPCSRVHQGIDLRVGTGDTVFAVAKGTVQTNEVQVCKEPGGCDRCINTRSGRQCKHAIEGAPWGWGQFVIIEHKSDHSFSLYAHLEPGSTSGLTVGQEVECGAPIGRADNSGSSFGSHLHFEYILPGQRIPPNASTSRTNPAACIANIIEAASHHLGNDPGNEGTVFEKSFAAPPCGLIDARLELDIQGPNLESPPEISINGHFAGTIQPFFPPLNPYSSLWQTNPDGTHDYLGTFHISLPVTLVDGQNTFRIRNGRFDDDYNFSNVVLGGTPGN